MTRRVRLCLLLLGGLLLMPLSCTTPRRDLNKEEVMAIESFVEIMWFLNTITEASFDLIEDKTIAELTTDDYSLFSDLGRRIPWAARRLVEYRFSKGPEFEKNVTELHTRGDVLQGAARMNDGKRSVMAIRSMKKACAACHLKYK